MIVLAMRPACAFTTATPSAVVTCSEHHLEAGKSARSGSNTSTKRASRSNDVDLGPGHLAVDEERHPRLPSRREPEHGGDRGHAELNCGGMRRIEFDRRQQSSVGMAGDDVGGISAVGEIGGHQRGEAHPPAPLPGSARDRPRPNAVVVVTGGVRLHTTIARPKARREAGTTARIGSPSRKWTPIVGAMKGQLVMSGPANTMNLLHEAKHTVAGRVWAGRESPKEKASVAAQV